MSYQIVIIEGNLGRDPESRKAQSSGKSVCKFSVAVSDKSGGNEHTEWFNAVCFDKTADVADRYLKKGSKVLLEGRLKTDEYEKDGEKKRFTSLLVSRLTLIDGAKNSNDNGGGRDRDEPTTPPRDMKTRAPVQDDDDGLPF